MELIFAICLMCVYIGASVAIAIMISICMMICRIIHGLKVAYKLRTHYGVSWKMLIIKAITLKLDDYEYDLYVKEEAEKKEKQKKLERKKRKKRLEQKKKKEEQKVLTTAKAEN